MFLLFNYTRRVQVSRNQIYGKRLIETNGDFCSLPHEGAKGKLAKFPCNLSFLFCEGDIDYKFSSDDIFVIYY